MNTYSYYNPVKILFGPKSLEKIGDLVEEYCKNQKILIVSGKTSMRKYGILDRIIKLLKGKGFNVETYEKVDSNPTYNFIDSSTENIMTKDFGLIIGIGGGSAIDCAKCMALLVKNPERIMEFLKNQKLIENRGIPLITIPSTSGTGSEVTSWATVWDMGKNKKKFSLANEKMYAKAAIIDPELTLSLSPRLTAISGLDAFSQAIEAFWSRNHNPISDFHAIEAIELIYNNILKAFKAPNNITYRTNMALGSLKSGLAFSNTKTTAVHSISYPITMNFNVPHGLAVALTLGQFLIYNSKPGPDNTQEAPRRIKKIANLMGVSNPIEASKKINELMKKMALPTTLSEIGIDEKGIELIINKGFTPDRIGHNPRRVTIEELKKLLYIIK